MNHLEKSKEYFVCQHYHCSQAVFAAFAEELGITTEQALKISGCFGGGMRNGEVCGCVTGALMALGLKYGQCDVSDYESREKADKVAKEFMQRFTDENGSYLCRDLLGYDFSKPEDAKKIQESKVYVTVCPPLVESATKIVEDILKDE